MAQNCNAVLTNTVPVPLNMFPPKIDTAFPLWQLEALLLLPIHTIYHHLSSRLHCDPQVRNGKRQHLAPVSQQQQLPGPHPTPPAIIFKAFGKQNTFHMHQRRTPCRLFIAGVTWGGEMRLLPPQQCCWQGHTCLIRTPWTTEAMQVCGWLHLPEAEQEGSFSFKKEMFLYLGVIRQLSPDVH